MSLQSNMIKLAREAHQASVYMATLPTGKKNKVLKAMAKALRKNKDRILKANAKDIKGGRAKKLSSALLDRLALDERRIESMASSIVAVAK